MGTRHASRGEKACERYGCYRSGGVPKRHSVLATQVGYLSLVNTHSIFQADLILLIGSQVVQLNHTAPVELPNHARDKDGSGAIQDNRAGPR